MHNSKFSQTLKTLRTARNITQEDLAGYLHVSRSTIAGYESRNKQPDYDKLLQIAAYFSVTVDYLLTGEQPSKASGTQMEKAKVQQMERTLVQTFHHLSYTSKQHLVEYSHLLQLRDKELQNKKQNIHK